MAYWTQSEEAQRRALYVANRFYRETDYRDLGRTVESEIQTGMKPAPLPERGETDYHLKCLSDAALRAECERRFPDGFGVVHETTLRECEHWKAVAKSAAADRDEWKRRAEAAEKDLAVALHNNREPGLTLAAGVERIDPRPDNSVAHLDEDLLCEDA